MLESKEEEFCIVDLWAAEAFLTAFDAGEVVLMQMLNSGIKIHQWMLDQTTEKFPKEVIDAEYNYHKAKQTVHALDYGVEPGRMHQESGLPHHVCDWQYNFFHSKFPGIHKRMYRIQKQLEQTRTLTSFLGRQKVFLAPYGKELLNQAYAWPSQSVIGELTVAALNKLYWRGKIYENIRTAHMEPFCSPDLLSIPWTFPSLNTHDGLAIRCFKNTRAAVKNSVAIAFDIPFHKDNLVLRIPVEIGWGENFNDVTDVEIIRYA